MFGSNQGNQQSLQQRMRLPAYQMLRSNVRNRLCRLEETLSQDFFMQRHSGDEDFIAQYRETPMTYHCKTASTLTHTGGEATTYLVIGGKDRVILMLEPANAMCRNLPFLAVLERGQHFFKPVLGSPVEYWQTHIEPSTHRAENVLVSPQVIRTVSPAQKLTTF